jgi:ketosteroid isomerase-like protein
MTGRKKSGETADLWFRATATLVKETGDWKITYAMDASGKAELKLKPWRTGGGRRRRAVDA